MTPGNSGKEGKYMVLPGYEARGFNDLKMTDISYEPFLKEMIEVIRAKGFPVKEAVLRAMERVPRHSYVETSELSRAYEDCPLPIGEGQTISQPFIVAWMTTLLKNIEGRRVLEVGTGSGYQAAILAEMGARVFTIERKKELFLSRKDFLEKLYPGKIHVYYGDGSQGYPWYAPYGGILVAAAASLIPEKLVEQLAVRGHMVIPIGDSYLQHLMTVTKTADGEVRTERGIGCRFVPLVCG